MATGSVVAVLAMDPAGLAEDVDRLAELAEGPAILPRGSGLGRLASVIGQRGPGDGPGLLDGDLLDPGHQLGQRVDQGVGDRAIAAPVEVLLDDRRGGSLL